MFKKAVLAMVLGAASLSAHANLTDCKSLFVRTFMVSKTAASEVSVTFGSTPSGGATSLNVFFGGWEDGRRKDVLALLMSARALQQTVSIRTDGPDGCNITTGYHTAEDITFEY